jgi:hypothetical protein
MTKTNKLNAIKDNRGNCYSVMTVMSVGDYLDTVKRAYEKRGGIEGQRDPLKTSTAVRIRGRMVEDLKDGAVLPPIVLGVIVSQSSFNRIEKITDVSFKNMIMDLPEECIFIIDGMQRTTALMEVSKRANINDRLMRVEYWIGHNTNSLIYRMLILNTGQVPWNLRRQIEIAFRSMIREIKKKVSSVEILTIDEQRRRARPGQFQADEVIELFLVFGARKEKIDTKERLADEFTRLDFIEATSESQFTDIFYEVLDYLGKFDVAFDKYKEKAQESNKFKDGKDLFGSQPVRVGFVSSIATQVLGRPGKQYSYSEQEERWASVKKNARSLLKRISKMDEGEVGNFLDFKTLNDLISQKTSKVGDFEREFFMKAFRVLIEEDFKVQNLTPCWRAY